MTSFIVRDAGQLEIKNGESLICGVQKQRRVRIAVKPVSQKGLSGEATALEFQP
jgi:hypothetical protein